MWDIMKKEQQYQQFIKLPSYRVDPTAYIKAQNIKVPGAGGGAMNLGKHSIHKKQQ